MKKIFILVITLILMINNLGFSSVNKDINENSKFSGLLFAETSLVSSPNNALDTKNASEVNIVVEKLNLEDKSVLLYGYISESNKKIPIELDGVKFASSNDVRRQIIVSSDKSGNFDVVYSALVNEMNENVLYLYLMEKGTRNFYMFELKLDVELNKSLEYYTILKELPEEHLDAEHWWVNVFEPEVKFIDTTSSYKSDDLLSLSSIGTMAVNTQTVIARYHEVDVTYHMDLVIETDVSNLPPGADPERNNSILVALGGQRQYQNGRIIGYHEILRLRNLNITVTLKDHGSSKFGRDRIAESMLSSSRHEKITSPSISFTVGFPLTSWLGLSLEKETRLWNNNGNYGWRNNTRKIEHNFPTVLNKEGSYNMVIFRVKSDNPAGHTFNSLQKIEFDISSRLGILNAHTDVGTGPRISTIVRYYN